MFLRFGSDVFVAFAWCAKPCLLSFLSAMRSFCTEPLFMFFTPVAFAWNTLNPSGGCLTPLRSLMHSLCVAVGGIGVVAWGRATERHSMAFSSSGWTLGTGYLLLDAMSPAIMPSKLVVQSQVRYAQQTHDGENLTNRHQAKNQTKQTRRRSQ